MIVVDASCAVEVVLGTVAAPSIEVHWKRSLSLHAPERIDLEVLQVLRRLVAAREISDDRATLAAGT
jgi:predicted nucleic acid-binding protein